MLKKVIVPVLGDYPKAVALRNYTKEAAIHPIVRRIADFFIGPRSYNDYDKLFGDLTHLLYLVLLALELPSIPP